MNNIKAFVHPEVLPLVKEEFNRLFNKHPLADGAKLWKYALQFANDVCMADTYLLNELMKESI